MSIAFKRDYAVTYNSETLQGNQSITSTTWTHPETLRNVGSFDQNGASLNTITIRDTGSASAWKAFLYMKDGSNNLAWISAHSGTREFRIYQSKGDGTNAVHRFLANESIITGAHVSEGSSFWISLRPGKDVSKSPAFSGDNWKHFLYFNDFEWATEVNSCKWLLTKREESSYRGKHLSVVTEHDRLDGDQLYQAHAFAPHAYHSRNIHVTADHNEFVSNNIDMMSRDYITFKSKRRWRISRTNIYGSYTSEHLYFQNSRPSNDSGAHGHKAKTQLVLTNEGALLNPYSESLGSEDAEIAANPKLLGWFFNESNNALYFKIIEHAQEQVRLFKITSGGVSSHTVYTYDDLRTHANGNLLTSQGHEDSDNPLWDLGYNGDTDNTDADPETATNVDADAPFET
jgi:hypothetical protein